MALRDHIGDDGIVTTEALRAAVKDEMAAATRAITSLEAAGQHAVADCLRASLDGDLDRLNELK